MDCRELATYLDRPIELVTERCKYAPYELAYLWPSYKDRTLDFYREAELYLFDLTLYQNILKERLTDIKFKESIKEHGFRNMLDFGGGIGNWTIWAIEAGADCDFLDVEGVMLDYARWRFEKRGFQPRIFKEDEIENIEFYDCIVASDVFEHIENPEPVIKNLSQKCKYMWCNEEEIPYNAIYPMHISHFTLNPYFEKINQYLWKSRFSQSA